MASSNAGDYWDGQDVGMATNGFTIADARLTHHVDVYNSGARVSRLPLFMMCEACSGKPSTAQIIANIMENY